jgi:hypothetical protein
MTHVDWMESGRYGAGTPYASGGQASEYGPDQPDPTGVYGQQVSLDAGVIPLQSEMAARSISSDFARLMATQPGYYGTSVSVAPSSIPGPEVQPSLPTYTPSSDATRTDIAIEESQVPVSVQVTAPVLSKPGVDPKWLIAAAVIGIFLALKR